MIGGFYQYYYVLLAQLITNGFDEHTFNILKLVENLNLKIITKAIIEIISSSICWNTLLID